MRVAIFREYCQRRGWTVFAEYVDEGIAVRKIPGQS